MKVYTLAPRGFACTLREAEPGPFLVGDQLCHKTEYRNQDLSCIAYCDSGEYFCSGDDTVVQPVSLTVEET